MKKKCNIAIVLNNAWYGYNFRLNLAKKLKQNGFTVYFIAPFDKKYSKLLSKDFNFIDIDIDAKGINPIKDTKTIITLYRIFKKYKINIVLNFTIKPNIYSSIAAGIQQVHSISNITGLGTIFINNSLVTSIAKLMYKVALKYNHTVFFQNEDDTELFLANKLVDKEKVDLLPGSGVDLDKFKPVAKNGNEDFVFLLVARLLRDKGIIEYIEAIKLLKKKYTNIRYQILGNVGVENKTAITKQELNEWIENGIIEYLGTTDSVEKVISQADCIVLPSYREGTPRSLLEACAMEKPVIATNVPGCKNVVEDEVNGYLCNAKDVDDLALKMEKMINLSKEERISMGKAGRNKILNEFDEKIVIKKYIEKIEKICQI